MTTAKRKKRRGPGRPFVKGDPRINRSGRPKSVQEIQASLRDPELANAWVCALREGVANGDPEMMKLYGKHAVGTSQQLELSGSVAHVPALADLTTEQLLKLLEATK